jgi:peptide/nickel transport system substrate-binding protein
MKSRDPGFRSLLQRPSEGGFTRRQFLEALAAAGLGAGSFALPAHAMRDPFEGVRGKGQPQRGGVLSFALNGDPPNFNPMANSTSRVSQVVGPCCNGLLRYDTYDPNKIVPDLAESYSMAPDGMAYTFKLRKGVKFHDGRPCTAEDVRYTFDVLREPPSGHISIRSGILAAVDGIEVVDPLTVRFVLKRRSPSLIAHLACGWLVVLPKHVLAKGPMERELIGTGPFKLKEYRRGVSIELVRNPDYFLPGKPHLDGIKVFIVPDANTAWGYFRTGQLDVINVANALAEEREKEAAQRAYMVGGTTTSTIAVYFNATAKPFDDVRVRQALCLAINREESLSTLQRGRGYIGGWSLPGPWALPKAEVNKIAGYAPWGPGNLARAKQLLAEAGHPNGFKDRLLVRRIPLFESHGIFVQDQLKKIGVDVTLDMQETASYYEKSRNRQFTLDATGRNYLLNDPDSMYGDSVTCGGAANRSGLCDARIDQLFQQQSAETDPKKRLPIVNELERRALGLYHSYTMYYLNAYRMFQNNVHGWALHPNEDNCTRFEDAWKSKA